MQLVMSPLQPHPTATPQSGLQASHEQNERTKKNQCKILMAPVWQQGAAQSPGSHGYAGKRETLGWPRQVIAGGEWMARQLLARLCQTHARLLHAELLWLPWTSIPRWCPVRQGFPCTGPPEFQPGSHGVPGIEHQGWVFPSLICMQANHPSVNSKDLLTLKKHKEIERTIFLE